MQSTNMQGYARFILRIVAGALFSMHGLQKLFGFFGGLGGHGATAPMWTQLWTGGVLEVTGGLLLVLGLFTRPAAFILCGEMAVAYFTMHAPRGFWPIRNGGELAVLYCFIFLYLVFTGPGALSLDSRLGRNLLGRKRGTART